MDDESQRESGEELEQFRRAVDAPQKQELDQGADDRHGYRGEKHGSPVANARTADPGDQRIGDIAAEHEQRTVREIHDPRDAENQRKPCSNQKERRGAGESVQQLDEQSRERHGLISPSVIAGRRSQRSNPLRVGMDCFASLAMALV